MTPPLTLALNVAVCGQEDTSVCSHLIEPLISDGDPPLAELAVPLLVVLPLLLLLLLPSDVLSPPEGVVLPSFDVALPPASSTVQLSHPKPSAITRHKAAALFQNVMLFMPSSLASRVFAAIE